MGIDLQSLKHGQMVLSRQGRYKSRVLYLAVGKTVLAAGSIKALCGHKYGTNNYLEIK